MRATCKTCGKRLPVQRAGRPPTYCSSACRQKAYRARRRNRMPAEMTTAVRWVAADGKRPITIDGHPASSTRPDTWCAHEAVKHGPHGFMLGAGFACIDLDAALDPHGQPEPWAQTILDAVPGAFVEVSVSGRGLHIFGLAPEAPGRNHGRVEYYSRDRFIRTTANVHTQGDLIALTPAMRLIDHMATQHTIPARPHRTRAGRTT